MRNHIYTFSCCFLVVAFFSSCKKLIEVPPPRNTITTEQMFNTIAQGEGALAGIYTVMINGDGNRTQAMATSGWAAGLITVAGSLSGGDMENSAGATEAGYYALTTNRLTLLTTTEATNIWTSAYKSIYVANSIVEGLAASTSDKITEKARKALSGEAKFVRALAYFYLVNLFGDVPLALTVDFYQTKSMTKTPADEVYKQIIKDLIDAREGMLPDYTTGAGERIRPNKWAATALLARVYLYRKDYANAASMAGEVIAQSGLYSLEPDLLKTFQANSRETIWQLKQTATHPTLRNATPEGYILFYNTYTQPTAFRLTNHLMNNFEPGDKRRADWVDSTMNVGGTGVKTFYPTKYRIGRTNNTVTAFKEYYMVLRFAEMFLVRSEARANGADGGPSAAVDDLNEIRFRAGLELLPNSMDAEGVLAAIEKERQLEFFTEWGHRWMDLKRTGKAAEVLSTIPLKNPWQSDDQLLYPIPPTEIKNNPLLQQNPGYIF